jgi:hypothetical protein
MRSDSLGGHVPQGVPIRGDQSGENPAMP